MDRNSLDEPIDENLLRENASPPLNQPTVQENNEKNIGVSPHIKFDKIPTPETNNHRTNSPKNNDENYQADSNPEIKQNFNTENPTTNSNANNSNENETNTNLSTDENRNYSENPSDVQPSSNPTSPHSRQRTYIVAPGDTIQSIALKFDTSVAWIKKQNNLFSDMIFDGDILKVMPENADYLPPDPILCFHFDTDNKFPPEKGRLFIIDDTLVFQPDSLRMKPLRINLVGHVESVSIPHPSGEHFIIMISYLSDYTNPQTMTMAYFYDTPQKIQTIVDEVKKAAARAQMQKNFPAPDPDAIRAQQPSRWRRSSNASVDEAMKSNKMGNISSSSRICEESIQTLPPPRKRIRLSQVQIVGDPSTILTQSDIDNVRANMPYRFRNMQWKLLYRLSVDGASYTTFFRRTEKASPVVLLLQTDIGENIGSYISCGLKFSRHYYGNGEVFIFRTSPKFEVYKWSIANNEYFVSSTQTEISIGGGGSSAIWIDGKLLSAISEPCPTFGSPCLTKTSNFKIIDLEIWKIG
ncbi:TLD family protein [Tritrichomonas foetus]|uniref:Oxidation resistance protein 1 n=1 Tax=Tritrichomonas foetus TaxID=1144522 RepID=A0A1J4JNC1_9EUKA|nr:TLD family protein [Tritrichomonas foetus]|eukprot:OHS98756.1 TLD family protein [Tritrichomonas foetus]